MAGGKRKKLGRSRDGRRALLRGILRELVLHGRIETSLARAKAARSFVERAVRTGSKGDMAAARQLTSILGNEEIARKVVGLAKEKKTSSGIVRVVRIGRRRGDNSPRARVELLVQVPAKTT